MCPSAPSDSQTGGVIIVGSVGYVGGDIVGGNKGLDEEKLVAVLEERGFIRTAAAGGLERETIIKLAQRLKPGDITFDQALVELERAVVVALDLIERGERGTNEGDFVDAVIKRVAAKTRSGDLDGGARAIDEGLAELDATHRRSRITLLEEGVQVDILRRDSSAVAKRIEAIVVIDQQIDRPSWSQAFRDRYDLFLADGEIKGINFSLSVAIELARRMAVTARDADECGVALNLLGNALLTLGERESGTARLEEAVAAHRAALEERTRERVPLDWAMTQMNLGTGLLTLGERESGTARLEEAVAAHRAALEERTRGRVPLDWAMTQKNLGNALWRLGRAGERHGASGGGGGGLSRGAGGEDARAGAARLGDDAEEPRHRALEARASGRAGRRVWRKRWRRIARRWRNGRASGCRSTGRRRRRTSAPRSGRLGRAGERDDASGGGGGGVPRGAGGKDARAGAARLGDDAEEPRQRALRG